MIARRFPRPWRTVEHRESYEVQDANGDGIAYVYFTDNEQRQSVTRRMRRDEARRIAANIARLLELLASDAGTTTAKPP